MPGGVDPIYQQQQQQYFYNKGLERAKKAQRERKVSRVKPGFVLAVAFVLVLAALFVLLGGLGIFDHQHVMVDGISYRIGSGGNNLAEKFAEFGLIIHPANDTAYHIFLCHTLQTNAYSPVFCYIGKIRRNKNISGGSGRYSFLSFL